MPRVITLTGAALLALPGLARAAEPSGGGMPQLDFANPLVIGQVVWMLIIFAVLYMVMAQVALPRVSAVLEDRQRRLDADLAAASLAKATADAAAAAQREASRAARIEAQAAIARAVAAAEADVQARTDAMNDRLAAQVAAADARIAASRDQAMGALRQVANDTATALITRLSGGAEATQTGRAVDRVLAARGHA